MNLSAIFIKKPVATTILIAGLIIFGIFSYRLLPVSELPNVDFPTIVVSANLSGADPESMASNVATPLEKQLSTIASIDSMSSVSTAGSTRITLQFDLSRDIDAAAQDVQTAIAQASRSLPAAMTMPPSLKKVNPTESPVLFIALTADHLSLSTLDEYAETVLGERLSMVKGVAQVGVFGSQQYAVRISLNPYALYSRGLGVDTIANALKTINPNQPAGTLQTLAHYHLLKVDGQLNNAADFANQIISTVNNQPVRLKDVGYVTDGVANDKVATWYNDKRAVVLAIQRQPGTNTVEVVQNVLNLLPTLSKQLPGEAKLQVVYDRSIFINQAIHDVQFTLIFAAFLVLLVMYFFLDNISSTIITTLSLPISLIATFSIMYLLGYGLDNLSMMGMVLAVGFVVDDAVVVLENIIRHLESGTNRLAAVFKGTEEVGFTVVSMTLSLVAVFLPILFMGGILGRLFHEFAVVVATSILFSGLIALTFIPVLSSRFLSTKSFKYDFGFHEFFEKTKAYYEKTLRLAIDNTRFVMYSMLAILLLTIVLFIVVPKGFIPSEDVGFIQGSTLVPEGIDYNDFLARQSAVTQIIAKNPDVSSYISTVGQGSNAASSANTGSISIELKPTAERSHNADQIIMALRKQIETIPGIRVMLQNPLAIRVGGISSSGNYQYELQGTDWSQLQVASQNVEDALRKIHGVMDVDSDLQMNNPELHLHILRDQAALLGITPEEIENALYAAYGESEVSEILTPTDEYEVILEIDPTQQTEISDLSKFYLKAANGNMVPLTSVATIEEGVGPLSVSHFGQLPAVTLSFNLAPNVSLSSVTAKINAAANTLLPSDVVGTFVGSAKTFQQTMQNLPELLLITILIIYMVLAILYEDFIHPLTILTALPFAGFGALIVLLVFGQELDIFSFIGIIMLVGLVKKNGIMMVDFAIDAQRTLNMPAKEAIIHACLTRYRPIMMTTMAAILATLPIALGLGAGGESRRSMGIAVVGGLLFSQLFTLYATPVFYLIMEKFSAKFKKIETANLKEEPATEQVQTH